MPVRAFLLRLRSGNLGLELKRQEEILPAYTAERLERPPM
jgi:hypothetical protein